MAFGPAATIVVLSPSSAATDALEAATIWRDETRTRNLAPERGLSSSVQTGLAVARAAAPALDGVFMVLGDQPRLSPTVLRALAAAAAHDPGSSSADRPSVSIIVPRYAEGGGANPALLLRAAWPLVDELSGDTGMARLIRDRPDLVRELPVPGSNPDVDTPAEDETSVRTGPAVLTTPPVVFVIRAEVRVSETGTFSTLVV